MTDTPQTNSPPPESQKQRWIKYGANVVLTSVLVIVIAGLLVYLGQKSKRRIDMTAAGDYTLKPQTINLIKDNKQKIKIYSLYTRQQQAENTTERVEGENALTHEDRIAQAQAVADLLEEYRTRGANIEVEEIDPVLNPSKSDDLVRSVSEKYAGQVSKYHDFTDPTKGYPRTYEKIYAFSKSELEVLAPLPFQEIHSPDLARAMTQVLTTVNDFPGDLKASEALIRPRLNLKPPDYKSVAGMVEIAMTSFSEKLNVIITRFTAMQNDAKVPQAIRDYMKASLPRYEEMKSLADGLIAECRSLGELKLDTLREALGPRNTILVAGENEWRVLTHDQVWRADNRDARRLLAAGEKQLKPRFAGEQMISSAILSLGAKSRPKVVFIRPGGAPLTNLGFPPFQPTGPLAVVAERLREYNFDVLEKDLSGQFAVQSQMQGMPALPEPGDEEIKDAIWIVLAVPTQPDNPMAMPPPSVAPKLLEHLMNGGSAMVLFMPGAENLSTALEPWGVEAMTNIMAIHEPVQTSGRESSDFVDNARKIPAIFILSDLGDHPLVRPLKSLDTAMLRPLVIKTANKPGYTASPLVPIPDSPKAWGEANLDEALQGTAVAFNPDKGDLPLPLFSGAAVEKKDGGRLVALGSIDFAINGDGRNQGPVEMLDAELFRRGIPSLRFPGNGELFVNSVFWLAKMDPMIAISPAAMDVNRIGPMSDRTLRNWRVGVLLIGLPGLVILAGLAVYFARRD